MDWTILGFCVFSYQISFQPVSSLAVALDERDNSCRGNFTDVEHGNFTSHNNYALAYPPSKKCGWLIASTAEEALIIASFQSFHVASHPRCDDFDIVQVYEQGEEAMWKSISPEEGYCGFLDPFIVVAKTRSVYITFKSDTIAKDNKNGFNVTFSIKNTRVKPAITGIGRVDGRNTDGIQSNYTEVIRVVEKDMITIQCYISGLPYPTVTWAKIKDDNGTETEEPIRDGLIKTKISNGSIQFHHIRLSDEGKYLCNATNNVGSVTATFQLVVEQKCLCPKKLKVFWYEYPPYTRYDSGGCKNKKCFKGIMYNVLDDMVRQVCGMCEKGHNESVVEWDEVDYMHKKLNDVKKEIVDGSTYDIYLPIEGGREDNKYRSSYDFLPIIESPGVAFMVVGEKEGSASQAVFNSIMDGWPILVLTVVMAFLSGIIIWMLDTYWNEEQFPRSLREGIAEGFWWAFVTMTTVGYGDIAPRGVPARIFAIIWILTGLVIIAIFTSVVTTSLTVVTMSTKKKLYGSVVGAISESSEYRTGVIKNAEMKDYSSFTKLHEAMFDKEISGCLIDSYVAAYYAKDFQKFRVNNIFVSNKAYGIVLGKRLSTSGIYYDFAKWVQSHKADITSRIKESSSTLKEPSGSAAMDKSSELFSPHSPIFRNSVIGTTIILVILAVGGLMFEYGYLRPRHRMIESAKNLEMVESTELKEMAYRAKCLKEILLSQVAEFSERWNQRLTDLKIKHKEEHNKFISRGKKVPTAPTHSSTAHIVCQSPASGDEMVGLDGVDTIDKPNPSPDYTTTIGL